MKSQEIVVDMTLFKGGANVMYIRRPLKGLAI